jgi:hypothetical protein
MPPITHYFNIPGENTFDSAKITVDGAARLLPDKTKVSGLFQLNGPGNQAIDESPNTYNFNYTGTTALWVPGKVGNAWQPEGGNYFIASNTTWYSITADQPFVISAWFQKTNDGQARFFFSKKQGSGLFRGYGFLLNQFGRVQVILTNTAPTKQISVQTTERFDDGNWHRVDICYDGNADANTIDIYVDNQLRAKNILDNNLQITDDITNVIPASIGGPSGTAPWINLLDQVIIWNTCISIDIINYMYNNGLGRETIPRYFNPAPSIFKTTGLTAPTGENARYTGLGVTYSVENEGIVGVQITIDGGITWLVYDIGTSSWISDGTSYNTVSEANDHMLTLAEPPLPPNISVKLFLISDQGFQITEVLNYVITYTEGLGPTIIIGPGKTTFDNQVVIPFATTTFTDPDGVVEIAEERSYLVIQEGITPTDGTINTIYLSAAASVDDDFYNGYYVYANGEFHLISDYVGSTKIATISDSWDNIPVTDDNYYIGDEIEPDWVNIPQGGWASLQEAVQNYEKVYRTDGPVFTLIRQYLKVTDDDTPANSTIDSKTISVNAYNITIDVRDPQGIPLSNFLFDPGDGRAAITESSPFNIYYAYGDFIMVISKDQYITTNQLIQVRNTGVTEFITLNQQLTLENLDQIWKVQMADAQISGSFGFAIYTMLNILTARPSGQVPLTVATVTWLNKLKACNVFRIDETPYITLEGDEDLTDAVNPFFEVIKPSGDKIEWSVTTAGRFASYQVQSGELNEIGRWRIRIVADNLGAFQGGTDFTIFSIIGEED